MKNLAQQKRFVRNGITFNSVAPGAIQIPNTGWDDVMKNSQEDYSEFVESLPAGRLGSPGEVADLVLFLVSDKAKYINGSSIIIDGGESSII